MDINRKRMDMDNNRIAFYMHAGSGNHGCEAIVNTSCKMLYRQVVLVSKSPDEDRKYSIGDICEIVPEQKITANPLIHAYYLMRKILLRDPESYMRYRYANIRGKQPFAVYVSIGGDNYCYEGMVQELILANRMFHKRGAKTVLWGCSIEPGLFKRKDVCEDMAAYDLIVARESLTYDALVNAGFGAHARLFPDPAFTLDTVYRPLPDNWKEGGMVGINVSPLIMEKEGHKGITYRNYRNLIQYIIEHSSRNIALIPHVVWDNNDDRIPLGQLFEEFSGTGRVVMVEDCSCMELKGYIARCELFVGARTHATIAAYSSLVPTLAVGYSVKALGIAKDIFGSTRDYVIPVRELKKESDLTEVYCRIERRESQIREYLREKMPEYTRRSAEAGKCLIEFLESEGV